MEIDAPNPLRRRLLASIAAVDTDALAAGIEDALMKMTPTPQSAVCTLVAGSSTYPFDFSCAVEFAAGTAADVSTMADTFKNVMQNAGIGSIMVNGVSYPAVVTNSSVSTQSGPSTPATVEAKSGSSSSATSMIIPVVAAVVGAAVIGLIVGVVLIRRRRANSRSSSFTNQSDKSDEKDEEFDPLHGFSARPPAPDAGVVALDMGDLRSFSRAAVPTSNHFVAPHMALGREDALVSPSSSMSAMQSARTHRPAEAF